MRGNRNKRVLCVGLICIDIVNVCKKFPEEGSDQRCERLKWQKGGNAANTSAVLAMLGHQVDFFGSIAKGSAEIFENVACQFVLKEMERFNVRMEHAVEFPEFSFPCSHVLINAVNGSRTITHHRKYLPEPTLKHFLSIDLSIYAWIHFEGRNLEEVVKMIEHVHHWNKSLENKEDKIIISVELEKPRKPNLHLLLPHADLAVISQDYARAFGYNSAVEAVDAYKSQTKAGAYVVCAWGSAGAAAGISGKPDDVVMIPAICPEAVVDTLGAGDTFLAGLVHGLSHGHKLPASVKFACRIAGHKVGSYGYDCLRGISHEIDGMPKGVNGNRGISHEIDGMPNGVNGN